MSSWRCPEFNAWALATLHQCRTRVADPNERRGDGVKISEYTGGLSWEVEPHQQRYILTGARADMPDLKLLGLASSLRVRAVEVLAQAETMKDAGAQRKVRGIAASYVKLAGAARRSRSRYRQGVSCSSDVAMSVQLGASTLDDLYPGVFGPSGHA
jgi:hypothetical protein